MESCFFLITGLAFEIDLELTFLGGIIFLGGMH
jgi:hypothetical protein